MLSNSLIVPQDCGCVCRCVKIEVLSPGDEAGGDVCDSSGLNMHMNMFRCVCLCESLSHFKASCHWLPDIRQAPVFWHRPILFHSAPHPMTKSEESMIYLLSFLINSLHSRSLLLFFFLCCYFPFSVFSPIPMERQRNVFMLQNGCTINEFCVKCSDFQLSLNYFIKRIWNAAEKS